MKTANYKYTLHIYLSTSYRRRTNETRQPRRCVSTFFHQLLRKISRPRMCAVKWSKESWQPTLWRNIQSLVWDPSSQDQLHLPKHSPAQRLRSWNRNLDHIRTRKRVCYLPGELLLLFPILFQLFSEPSITNICK